MLDLALAEGAECRIAGLTGDFRFLSNFHPAPIEVDRIVYPTLEHAYQAAKTNDRAEKLAISLLASAGRAKRYRFQRRKDWNEDKLAVMEFLVELKFLTRGELGQKLIATKTAYIEETNSWGDRFWGVCDGTGENHLGLILMRVRQQIMDQTVRTTSN